MQPEAIALLAALVLFLLLRAPSVHRFTLRAMQRSHRNRMKRYTKARARRVR